MNDQKRDYSGLGYAIAKRVAMMGATVILACRSEEKARNVSGKSMEIIYVKY